MSRYLASPTAVWNSILTYASPRGGAGAILINIDNRADAMRNLAMATFRTFHGVKKAIEDGAFSGTWEQRESMMQMVEEFEEAKASFLEDITAEDIRQLQDEGVL